MTDGAGDDVVARAQARRAERLQLQEEEDRKHARWGRQAAEIFSELAALSERYVSSLKVAGAHHEYITIVEDVADTETRTVGIFRRREETRLTSRQEVIDQGWILLGWRQYNDRVYSGMDDIGQVHTWFSFLVLGEAGEFYEVNGGPGSTSQRLSSYFNMPDPLARAGPHDRKQLVGRLTPAQVLSTTQGAYTDDRFIPLPTPDATIPPEAFRTFLDATADALTERLAYLGIDWDR
jgi:hypothetical protein